MTARSEPAACIQPRLFLGRVRAGEGAVAMREAAETTDHVAMRFGVFHVVRVAKGGAQGNAAVLVGDVFGMFERQVEEHAQRGVDLGIEADVERAARVLACERVGGEGVRAVAEDVARYLIEQQDQRERAVGGGKQVFVFAACGGVVIVEKAGAQLDVEGSVFCEPFRGTGITPDVDNSCITIAVYHEFQRSIFSMIALIFSIQSSRDFIRSTDMCGRQRIARSILSMCVIPSTFSA